MTQPQGLGKEYCEILLEVGEDKFSVFATGSCAETIALLKVGDRFRVRGRLVIVKWDTLSGPRERVAVEMVDGPEKGT